MIDTRVAGSPGDLRAAAAYLTEVLGPGLRELADRVAAQRSVLGDAWEGRAGSAFADRAGILVRAGDAVGDAAQAMGRQLAVAAEVLESVQAGMVAVLDGARAAGLAVQGTTVLPPGLALSGDGPALSLDQARASAYDRARERHRELTATWTETLTRTDDLVRTHATTILQVTVGLVVGGYSAALLRRQAGVLSAVAAEKRGEVARLQGYADDVADGLRSGRIAPSRDLYGHLDSLRDRRLLAADQAGRAHEAARKPRLPVGLARGLGVLGPLATAYGFYDDRRHGESVEQAALSQGGGAASGMVAGLAVGAGVGSVVPVAGTAVGAVAGAVAGAGVAVVTSTAIDRRYQRQQADADDERRRDERRHRETLLRERLSVAEGRPLLSTPGSERPYPDLPGASR